jgi:hypothetical protein
MSLQILDISGGFGAKRKIHSDHHKLWIESWDKNLIDKFLWRQTGKIFGEFDDCGGRSAMRRELMHSIMERQ